LVAAIATLELDPLSQTQPSTPPALDHVAKRCLAKNPDDRWQTAHDLNLQLRWIADKSGKMGGAVPGRERRVLIALAAVPLLVGLLAPPAALYFRGSNGDQEAFQFRIPVYGINQSDIAVSPNGEMLAFVARPDPPEPAALYVRPVNAMTFRRVAGT